MASQKGPKEERVAVGGSTRPDGGLAALGAVTQADGWVVSGYSASRGLPAGQQQEAVRQLAAGLGTEAR